VLYLVYPIAASRRPLDGARQAGLAEVGKGTQTPQHGRHKCSTPRLELNPNCRMALPCSAACVRPILRVAKMVLCLAASSWQGRPR
jgi:hypothetical protein